MLGYTQTWIETVNGDDFSDPQPIAIKLLQMENGQWNAQLESEGYTLLDAQCMQDLK